MTTFVFIFIAVAAIGVLTLGMRSAYNLGYDYGFKKGRLQARRDLNAAKRKALESFTQKDIVHISEVFTRAFLIRLRRQGALDDPQPGEPDR